MRDVAAAWIVAMLTMTAAAPVSAQESCPDGKIFVEDHCENRSRSIIVRPTDGEPIDSATDAGSDDRAAGEVDWTKIEEPERPVALPNQGRIAHPVAMRRARAARDRSIHAVRVYLNGADIPPKGVGGYGIVAFTGKPTAATRDRLVRVCEAFTHYLPRQSSLPRSIELSDQMVTVWPVEDPEAPAAKADDCGYLTDHYDLDAGLLAIQDARRQKLRLSGIGPFLIAWSPSEARGKPDKVVLVYDLSKYLSQDSFNQSFIFWQSEIVKNPGLWSNASGWQRFRLSFRDFFDAHSDVVADALHLAPGNK